jgi:hypothetical protein
MSHHLKMTHSKLLLPAPRGFFFPYRNSSRAPPSYCNPLFYIGNDLKQLGGSAGSAPRVYSTFFSDFKQFLFVGRIRSRAGFLPVEKEAPTCAGCTFLGDKKDLHLLLRGHATEQPEYDSSLPLFLPRPPSAGKSRDSTQRRGQIPADLTAR